MNRYVCSIGVVLLLCASPSLIAQQKKSKKDPPKQEVKQEAMEELLVDEMTPPVPPASNMLFDTTSVPNDELTQAIKGLLRATGAMDLGKQIGKGILDAQKQNPNPTLPQEFYDRLIKEFDNEQTNKWMTNSVVRVYREKFTLEEIKTIAAFYETPTGKKAVSLLPAITQECMKQGEMIGQHIGINLYLEMVKEGKIKQ